MKARITLIATLVVAAAVLAPAALAARPDDRAGALGAGSIAADQSSHVRPDDRAGVRAGFESAATGSDAARPDDRGGARGPGTPSDTPAVHTTSTGFDWSDALIGALTGVGIALVLMGTLLLVTSRRARTKIA